MGSESKNHQIPIIDVSKEIERGSEEWIEVSKRVREACEDYGCFELICDQIPSKLREEIFKMMNKLYGLPMETKKKNTNSNAFMAYASPNPIIPLLESFGIEDASNEDSIKAFAQMMMSQDPNAQDHFCKIFNNLVKPLDDLHKKILNLIVDSYDTISDKTETVSTMATQILLRTMKYKPSPPGQDILGAYPHTDKPLCTLLCEDQSGLEISTKNGEYFLWIPTHPNSFIFNVGDPLMVWSNGRLHSMKHRVAFKGDKERHSIAAFLFPVPNTIIKTQEELIDEDHLRIFKPFNHSEYLKFCTSIDPTVESDKMVFRFAGI